MINLSRVLSSPMLSQTYNIYRNTGHFGIGGWIQDSETVIPTRGNMWPSTDREIEQVPEGDRIKGMHTFTSAVELRVSNDQNSGTSDQIVWSGERYRLIQTLPFSDYGFHVAVGARIKGN